MQVSIKSPHDVGEVAWAIEDAIMNHSRFNLKVEVQGKTRIKLRSVRLDESKPYCGSHPFLCDIEGGRRGIWLEGLDWVEFNDRINDVLDKLHVSANVRSAVCIIRKDTRRRMVYGGHYARWAMDANGKMRKYEVAECPIDLINPQPEWNKDEPDECYEDWCGAIAPDSEYPMGPGLYERKVSEVVG